MTQRELDRAVARATGETVAEIRRRGFSLLKGPRVLTRHRRSRKVFRAMVPVSKISSSEKEAVHA